MCRWLRSTNDAAILVGILLVSACIGSVFQFETANLPVESVAPDFFGPAVMIACGRGFTTPVASTVPELANFLTQKQADFDPKHLPPNVQTFPNDRFESNHFYLLTAAGLLWRVFGIHWQVLRLLGLILFCAMACILYGVFRLGMGRIVSAVATLLTMTAPLTLSALPSVRDFGKAPFILCVLLILGSMVKRPVTSRILFAAAFGLGVIIGVGQGFRQDVFICILPAIAVLGFFARGMKRLPILHRLAAIVLLIVTYVVVGLPSQAHSPEEGSLMFHNAMMGLAPECSDLLGIGRSSYELEYLCNDNLAHATRCSYARRVKGNKNPITYGALEGSRAGKDFLLDVVKNFPADFVTRGLAASRFALSGNGTFLTSFAPFQNQLIARMATLHKPIAACINIIGLAAAAIVLLGLSRKELRLATSTLFLFLYFGSYGAMLFMMRHNFHVCFMPFWFTGLLIDRTLRSLPSLRHWKWRRIVSWQSPEARRMAAFTALVLAGLLLPLAAIREYQSARVGSWLNTFRTAQLERVEVEQRDFNGWPLFRPAGLAEPWPVHNLSRNEDAKSSLPLPPGAGPTFDPYEMDPAASYWAVALSGNTTRCPVAVRYQTENSSNDFSRILCIQPGGTDEQAETLFFFPVYEFPASVTLGQSRFVGVALPPERAAEFKGLYRVTDLSSFPFLPVLSLPKDTNLFRRCQTIWPSQSQQAERCPDFQ